MKLLEFKRIEDKGGKYGIDPDGEYDWFVKLTNKKERELYERMNVITEDCPALVQAYDDWNGRLKANLNVEDDDIFYYFMEDEKIPRVGETFTIDELVFKREK